jgi:hypothetical protein
MNISIVVRFRATPFGLTRPAAALYAIVAGWRRRARVETGLLRVGARVGACVYVGALAKLEVFKELSALIS